VVEGAHRGVSVRMNERRWRVPRPRSSKSTLTCALVRNVHVASILHQPIFHSSRCCAPATCGYLWDVSTRCAVVNLLLDDMGRGAFFPTKLCPRWEPSLLIESTHRQPHGVKRVVRHGAAVVQHRGRLHELERHAVRGLA
jgi:hypothetical protein